MQAGREALEKFRAYFDAGGKCFWVGGEEKQLLGALSASLVPVKDELLPVSKKYGAANAEIVAKSSIAFEGAFRFACGRCACRRPVAATV